MTPDTSILWLVGAQIVALLGLTVVARMRLARDPKIGKPFHIEHDSGGLKPALFALHTGLLIVAFVSEGFPKMHSLIALYGALMLTWLAPGAYDRACGETGVFRGWYARRYEELEEWRLTSDHLRFKLFGEWTFVEIPPEKRGKLRAILERAAPDRESLPPE